MEGKLIVNGQEIKVQISQEEYEKLTKSNKTGYERVAHGERFYIVNSEGQVNVWEDLDYTCDKIMYEQGNYYTDKNLAVANARADKLMRNLRRFAAEHRTTEVSWGSYTPKKYFIQYNYVTNKLGCVYNTVCKYVGIVCFETDEIADAAIEKFKDELIWYFTEYKDSL